MPLTDVRNGRSWAWLLVLCPWGIAVETDVKAINENGMTVHDDALQKIDNLLLIVKNVSDENNTFDNIGLQDTSLIKHPPLVMTTFLRLMSQLCSLLHPFKSVQNHLILVPQITFEPIDHFGCKSVLTTIKTNFTSAPRKWSQFIVLSAKNIVQWRQKLIGVTIDDAMENRSKYYSLLRKPTPTLTTTASRKQISNPTTTKPFHKWNKGVSRYDNSWIGPDFNNKFAGRELIFYDHYDPSKKDNTRLTIVHSTLRILPAVIIIAFLILCWYCFVFRRMRRRHRRTRTLLSQYQALLNGHSTSIVVGNADGHVLCSTSTFDSCLNEQSCDNDSSRENTHHPSSRVLANQQNAVAARPTSYPPTYDDIFPPPYDSLYGNVV